MSLPGVGLMHLILVNNPSRSSAAHGGSRLPFYSWLAFLFGQSRPQGPSNLQGILAPCSVPHAAGYTLPSGSLRCPGHPGQGRAEQGPCCWELQLLPSCPACPAAGSPPVSGVSAPSFFKQNPLCDGKFIT